MYPLRFRQPCIASAFFLSSVFFCLLLNPLQSQAQIQQITQAGSPDIPLHITHEIYTLEKETQHTRLVVVWITPDPGYHFYANPAGQTGLPVRLTARLADTQLPVLYPQGTRKSDVFDPAKQVFVYEKATPLFIPLPADSIQKAPLQITVSLLLCSATSCWPVEQSFSLAAAVLLENTLPAAQNADWFARYQTARPETMAADTEKNSAQQTDTAWNLTPRYFQPALEVRTLWTALFFAFIAGLILNGMPCVLPVAGLKLSSLLAGLGEKDTRARTRAFREHMLFFSAGILLYFSLLAALLSSLGLVWGQLFQNATLVFLMAALVFALGLSLAGLYDLPVIDLKFRSLKKFALQDKGAAQTNPKFQALFSGVLATLLATPCSGPFLGGVLAWTLMQPATFIILVFITTGLGMSAPFLLMALYPSLVRFFPKPGSWMQYLEKLAAFFLFGTSVYLWTILPESRQTPALIFFWVIAFAAWIWGQWTGLHHSRIRRYSIRTVAALLVLLAWVFLMYPAPQHAKTPWRPFSPEALRSVTAQHAVVVDFTADWCPSCKILESTVLTAENRARWASQYTLVFMQADLTQDNPQAQALLEALGSRSIPVVAIFPSAQQKNTRQPLVLRDLFTAGQMDTALKQALAK